MPRPKRSKVAPSANPAPRAAAASKAPEPTPARKAVAEDIESGIEDGEKVYTSVRRVPRTNTRRKAAEIRATSTVTKTATSGLRRGRGEEPAENSDAEDNEDEQERGASTPSIEMSRRDTITPTVETSIFRRGKQPAADRKAPKDIVSSIESDIAVAPITLPRMENTILGQPTFRGRARQRAPSILGKGAGAARARSSSMGLEMNTAGNSSMPGTAQSTRFGMMRGRRRERQPSILGSNKKKMLMQREAEQGAQGEDEEEDTGGDLDDFNDFNPDDESTPLNVQKTKSVSAGDNSSTAIPVSTSSNSRKRRKISEFEVSEIQVPRSPSLPRPSPPLPTEDDIYGVSSPVRPRRVASQTIRNSSPPLPSEDDIYGVSSPVRHRPAEAQIIRQSESHSRSATPEIERLASEEAPPPQSAATPEPQSETNAPPRSSSPSTPTFPRTNFSSVQQQRQIISRGRQILATQDSPISSPPSLTHSPNYKVTTKPLTKKQAAKKAKDEAPLTTAALQNLLPQRRRRGRRERDVFEMLSSDGEEEIDVSGLRPDDDELSYLNAPTRRGRTRTPGIGKGRAKTPASASSKTTAKKTIRKAKQNSKAATTSSAAKGTQNTKRTYGSLAANKENLDVDDEVEGNGTGEGDDSLAPDANDTPEDENSQELEERIGKELKRLKRKFEVVDQWEMEFEDVAGNSSDDKRMADAR